MMQHINCFVACPICGVVPLVDITIYNIALRKQAFSLSPILPTCNICGSEVQVKGSTGGMKVLLLNGTCGAGKSTTAEELVQNYGYHAIDIDCVMQVLLYKLGYRPPNNAQEMLDEVSMQMDILAAVTREIVISAVIEPVDLQRYIDIFEAGDVDYRIVLLKPSYDVAVYRTQTCICHTSITPEEWVRYFYDRQIFEAMETIDNSDMTVQETTQLILQRFGW